MGVGRNRCICVEMGVRAWMEQQVTVHVCWWRDWGIGCGGKDGVCVCIQRLGCACGGRDGCLCVCGEMGDVWRGGLYACLFVEKQEVSGGTDRGVCVYVERLGCGCGELRHVEQEVGVCWELGWRDGEVGKETGLFGCVCVGRDMVWVFVGVYVCWRNWGLCVCVYV